MKEARQHIAVFFLALSMSFVLPLVYWHECTESVHEHVHQPFHGHSIESSSLDQHCDVCDFHFTPVVFLKGLRIQMPVPSESWQAAIDYHTPSFSVPEFFLLRAPPIG